MDLETRKKICQLVAGIVIADDVLDEKEEAFVDRMIQGFGLAHLERDVIFPLVEADEAAEQMRQLPEHARAEALRLLVRAAAADGQIAAEERAYLMTVARAIRISEDDMEQRLTAALEE